MQLLQQPAQSSVDSEPSSRLLYIRNNCDPPGETNQTHQIKEIPVPSMNPLELEQEIGRMARAIMTRNSLIGQDLVAHLRSRLGLECLAGLMLVSVERVIWFDTTSVLWAIENIIPSDVMQEIHSMTTLSMCKHLIGKGLAPGKDFSVNATGQLLVNEEAKRLVLTR